MRSRRGWKPLRLPDTAPPWCPAPCMATHTPTAPRVSQGAAVLLAAVLTVGAASPTSAPASPENAPEMGVRITAPDAAVVLGRDARVPLTVVVHDAAGQPVDPDGPVQLAASAGRLERPQRLSVGIFSVGWLPPPQRFPHAAMVLAYAHVARTPVVGAQVVPLWGQGSLRVQTKPGASVTVQVGQASYGPQLANAQGEALFTVQAPPGPSRALATSVDRAGNQTQQWLDLAVPDFARAAVFAPWDGKVDQQGWVIVVRCDPHAAPDTHMRGVVGVDPPGAASVGELRQLAPGLAVVSVTPRLPGRLRVATTLDPGEPAGATSWLQVAVAPAVGADFRLSPAASGGVDVVAQLRNAAGQPAAAPGAQLRVTGPAQLEVAVPDGSVWLRGRVVAVPGAPPLPAVAVEVVDADGRVLGRRKVEPGGPLQALHAGAVVPAAPGLHPRGTVMVAITATTAQGLAVPPGALSLMSPDGARMLARKDLTDGRVQLWILPPASGVRKTVPVTVRAANGVSVVVAVPALHQRMPEWVVTLGASGRTNLGRLMLGGGAVDFSLSIPIPLHHWPVRLAPLLSLSHGAEAALPVRVWAWPALSTQRVVTAVTAMAWAGGEVGMGPWRWQAQLGAGLSGVHARVLNPGAQPPALLWWPETLEPFGTATSLGQLAPALGARVRMTVELGPGFGVAETRWDGPLPWKGPVHGTWGGPQLVLGWGFRL